MANSAWASKRLIYRALESTDQDFIYETVVTDPEAFFNLTAILPVPYGKDDAATGLEITKKAFMSAMICIPAAPLEDEHTTKPAPTPVGIVSLQGGQANRSQHRTANIAINIRKEYQGKGYGSEAVLWITEWAFMYGNLHRVGIGAYGFNEGAIRLYKKLGFTLEGEERESLFFRGRYWNAVKMGMLDREWWELYGDKQQARDIAPANAAKELGLR